MRILLVEDNPTDALLVEAALEDSKVPLSVFVHVETLAQAEVQIRAASFDVILVDLNVPDGQGLGNFERIQRAAPPVPVIVLTGVADEQTALDAIQRGAADYLIKGQTETAILDRSIRYSIERKRNEKQRLALERAEIKRAEAEASNRAKDEFLAMLSHELRTPLNAILGWTSLLQAESLDAPTTAQALDIIERNARVQAQLIEDLLDVSRIVAGNLSIERVNVDFNSLVSAACETLALTFNAKNQRLSLELESLPKICGDAMRLQQVIWNLLTNAIKFTPENGEIVLRTLFEDGEKPTAILEVCDTGQGIEPEFLPHIFERFRQADGSTTRRHGGLGLGLAIAKNVVELHGGAISAQSDGKNRGTTFCVRLPLASRECEPMNGVDSPAFQPMDWSGVRVLIVDDETSETGQFAQISLAQRGADVKTTLSASDALLLMENWRPNCLICVLGPANLDGFEILKGKVASEKIVPVGFTRLTLRGDRERALEAGFTEFLSKPIEAETFCAAIEGALQNRPN